MNWWTSEAVAYTKTDFEGHRIRLLIAEKRARISTRIYGIDDFPESLTEVNPDQHYPVLIDKNLICHGAALDELIHERFPSPTLLPIDPIKRAQVRMLAYQVRGWYSLQTRALREKLREVEEAYNDTPTHFIIDNTISVVDIALAPLLYEAITLGHYVPGIRLCGYVERIQARPAFTQSLRSSTPAAPEEELDEVA